LGKTLVTHPAVKKVDVTVRTLGPERDTTDRGQAGTKTGKAIGSLAGENLASYTAELGGKASDSVYLCH
jgi:hypothetical protein